MSRSIVYSEYSQNLAQATIDTRILADICLQLTDLWDIMIVILLHDRSPSNVAQISLGKLKVHHIPDMLVGIGLRTHEWLTIKI